MFYTLSIGSLTITSLTIGARVDLERCWYENTQNAATAVTSRNATNNHLIWDCAKGTGRFSNEAASLSKAAYGH